MKILVDAVLFQVGRADSAEARLCASVLEGAIGIAAVREIAVTVLDRGGLPPLGRVEVIGFPSFHAADALADAVLLQRMSEWIGADAFVSTALTMPLSIPTVQLICCEDPRALTPGRVTAAEIAECEIALACSSAVVCASQTSEEALRSGFPGRRYRIGERALAASGTASRERRVAMTVVDAAVTAPPAFEDADIARRILALRRIQAAFEFANA